MSNTNPREQALLNLIAALWRELAAVRDAPGLSWTACFDDGSGREDSPVRVTLINCYGQGLAADIEAATGEPMARRIGGFEDSLRAAWRKDRDAQPVHVANDEGYLPCPKHGVHSFPSRPCYMCGWVPNL